MVRVLVPEVKRFITECLRSVGAKIRPAKQQAELLIYADKMGLSSQGLSKLDTYVYHIESGLCLPNNKPVVLREEPSTSWIDVKSVMGATAGHYAMQRAIRIANKTGVGYVLATGCNHVAEPFSYWVQQATDRGLIGMAFSTASAPLYKQLQLESAQPLLLGSAKNELVPISDVQIVYGDQNLEAKKPQKSISDFFKTGYKKPRFQTILELLKGFPGKENLQSWSAEPLAKTLVHSFVAINPTCYALGIDSRCSNDTDVWEQWDEIDSKLTELLEPSEVRRSHRDTDSLSYEIQQINASNLLAHKLGVKPMDLHDDD